MEQKNLSILKQEIQLKAKNGIDFILAASIVWIGISLIWTFTINTPYEKSVFTLVFGAILLAFGFIIIWGIFKLRPNNKSLFQQMERLLRFERLLRSKNIRTKMK